MAKKGWGKIVAATAIIGTAVAAGIAYYKKYRQLLDSCKDEYDDYDFDFDEDEDASDEYCGECAIDDDAQKSVVIEDNASEEK